MHPGSQFAYAHSHFYPRSLDISSSTAANLVQQVMHRCAQLSISQLHWLADTTAPRASSSASPGHEPLPPALQPSSATPPVLLNRSCLPVSPPPTVPLTSPPVPCAVAAPLPSPQHLSSDLAANCTSPPRLSRSRKHKRRARTATAHEDASSDNIPIAVASNSPSHLTVVYRNTNGHLILHSARSTAADVCRSPQCHFRRVLCCSNQILSTWKCCITPRYFATLS